MTAVIAPWTAPVAAPTMALRTVVTACAIAAPAFLVTVCVPARAFVLVTFVCFASARLVWTFLVALAGLPVRARCFVGERFFRLEGTARARGVFPREPARPRFFFRFRVGMANSPCERWSAFVRAPSPWDRMSRPLAMFTSSHRYPATSPATDRPGRIWPSPAALTRTRLDETVAHAPTAPSRLA